jgi:hypothetical protein
MLLRPCVGTDQSPGAGLGDRLQVPSSLPGEVWASGGDGWGVGGHGFRKDAEPSDACPGACAVQGNGSVNLLGLSRNDPSCSSKLLRLLQSIFAQRQRCNLTESQKERIRTRVIAMLRRGFMPGEFRDYARLLRRIGVKAHREELLHGVDRTNPWAAWYVGYLLNENPGPKPDPRTH